MTSHVLGFTPVEIPMFCAACYGCITLIAPFYNEWCVYLSLPSRQTVDWGPAPPGPLGNLRPLWVVTLSPVSAEVGTSARAYQSRSNSLTSSAIPAELLAKSVLVSHLTQSRLYWGLFPNQPANLLCILIPVFLVTRIACIHTNVFRR